MKTCYNMKYGIKTDDIWCSCPPWQQICVLFLYGYVKGAIFVSSLPVTFLT